MAERRGREPGIDLARGLAVFGMFAAHVLVTAPRFSWSDPGTWTAAVHGNSSILFATLAGVSLGLMTGGDRPHGRARLALDRRRIAARAAAIFALGVVLWMLPAPVYVILPAYGILFLLALPLLGLRPALLAGIAAAVALVAPFLVDAIDASRFWVSDEGRVVSDLVGWHYPFLAWIAFVAAGLAIARFGTAPSVGLAGIGLAAAGVSLIGFGVVARGAHPALSADPHTTGVGEMLGSGGLAIAIVCACVFVCATPARWILWPVRAVGSMPLTAYTAQLVAWSVWIWMQPDGVNPITGFQEARPFWPMSLATLVACSAWSLALGRGPLERAVGAIALAAAPGGASRAR